jgi:uncharacterized membrane protein YphA (DoxX/SURF4 family)
MTFSQYAGIAIVPTLARIVLAAVFITAGWNKVRDADFTPLEAARLKHMGVNVQEVRPIVKRTAPSGMPVGSATGEAEFLLVSFLQSTASDNPGQEPAPSVQPDASAGQTTPDATQPDGASPPTVSNAPIEPLPPGQYRALGMYHIALTLENHGLKPQMCVWCARVAAFTELLGGAMLLLGLFSRLWGLGLAVVMGVAFYLVSMKTHQIFQSNPFEFARDPFAFGIAIRQLTLFVLAFGIFLTGAGPLSIDRILFGRDSAGEGPGVSDA